MNTTGLFNALTKTCKKCGVETDIDNFHNHRSKSDGKAMYCKPCNNAMMKPKSKEAANRDSKNYALRNPDKIKSTFNSWYYKNQETILAKKREKDKCSQRILKRKIWTSANKDRINEQRRLRRKNPTPYQVLEKALRDRFNKVIVRMKNGTKHTSCMDLIGCEFEFLKQHIERQFIDGMNWDNHGNGDMKWNIDHIKPLCTFDLHDLDQQKIAFNYTNLQPLWFIDNMKKPRKYGNY